MPDPAILGFVQSQRSAGASDETIAMQLRNSGWPESEINAAIGGPQPVQAPIYPGYQSNPSAAFRPSEAMKGFITQIIIFSLAGSAITFAGQYITGLFFSAFFAPALMALGGMTGAIGGNPFLPSITGFLFDCIITVVVWSAISWFIVSQMKKVDSIKQAIPFIGTKKISIFKAFFWPSIVVNLIFGPLAMGIALLISPILFIPFAISFGFSVAGDFVFAWGASRAFMKYFNMYYI